MRAATAGAFGVGFACGVVALGAMVLWHSDAKGDIVSAQVPAVKPALQPPSVEAAPPSGEALPHLRMPLDGVRAEQLTDTYSDKRDGHTHEALDIPALRGTPVRAVAEGNVARLFTSKAGGLTVYQFDNSQTWCFYYAHLDGYASGLQEGTLLRPGDVLGYVGTTGNAPANVPHLHFAVFRLGPEKEWWKGTPIDPLPLLR